MPRPSHPSASLPAMHLSFLFSGSGTLLCGAVLPALEQRWHLSDTQAGTLIGAQFLGLFLGAIALSKDLRRTLLLGFVTASAAFLGLAFGAHAQGGYPLGLASFFVLGLGLGQVTTTVNLLSALRYRQPQQRSAALSLLNFTWSAGAVLSPVIAGLYLAHLTLFLLEISFCGLGLACLLVVRRAIPADTGSPAEASASAISGASFVAVAYFFALYFLYGGMEASIGGWISTYAYRYAALGLAGAAYMSTAFWVAFASGRAAAGVLLRRIGDRTLRAAGLIVAVLASLALRNAHTGTQIALCAIATGLGIGPFFPITFSILIAARLSPRQAGAATANVALGSAIVPYLTGVISTQAGSLKFALGAPVVAGIALLLLSSLSLREHQR